MEGQSLGTSGAVAVFALFLALAGLETVRPAQTPAKGWASRWLGNTAMYLLTGGLFMLPLLASLTTAAIAAAAWRGALDALGLFRPLQVIVGVLALDATVYATHRALHRFAPLWRVHAVHHSDPDLDVTTTLRHHPAEAVFSAGMMAIAVFILGISSVSIAAYALLEAAVQLAAHANVALPRRLDAILRSVIVTPGYHCLHHSRDVAETDTNYSQVFTIWDRLFRTASDSAAERPRIDFGLDDFRDSRSQRPDRLLAQPLLPRQIAVGGLASPRQGWQGQFNTELH
jgi:sterol desaturase/sphingolipid hydroxylase (fatty acid hydroxylase superfamily)